MRHLRLPNSIRLLLQILQEILASIPHMQCYNPLTAYKTMDGKVVFNESRKEDTTQQLQLPCGQCTGCKLERSRQWAARCLHEAQMHKENCFITLTYNDENLTSLSLEYRDFQLFLKRLRKSLGRDKIRFYMCGEYGELNSRPHFHACMFGLSFPDMIYHGKSPSGSKVYVSDALSKLWTKGYSSVGEVNFESAAYVARYIMKKVTYDDQTPEQKKWREIIDPDTGEIHARKQEFNNMSRRPGIGKEWIEKYNSDVYPNGEMIIRGHKTKSTRYYDLQQQKNNPLDYEQMQYERHKIARQTHADNTPERLKVKEQVTKAKIKTLLRNKI